MDAKTLIMGLLNPNQQEEYLPQPDISQGTDYPMERISSGDIGPMGQPREAMVSGPNTVMFDQGAPERIREMFGTQGLPGSVSQMPAQPEDPNYEENVLSVILPPKEFLDYKLKKGQIDAQKEMTINNRNADLLRTLVQSENAGYREKLFTLQQEKFDEDKIEKEKAQKVSLLSGYISSRKDLVDFAKGMVPENVLYKARDIALTTGDEEVANMYNDAIIHFPELDPIEMEDVRAASLSIIENQNEIKKESISTFFDDMLLALGQQVGYKHKLPGMLKSWEPKEIYGPGTLKYPELYKDQ